MPARKVKTRRAKAPIMKAGATRDPKRKYSDGGKIYCKGGKLK